MAVVDFTSPFQFTSPVIVMHRPDAYNKRNPIRLSAILKPIESSVWLLTILAFFVASCVIYVISYVNPYEWRRMSHEGEATIREGESFTCLNAFFFSVGAFALQGIIIVCPCPLHNILLHSPLLLYGILMVKVVTRLLMTTVSSKYW